MLRRLQRAVLLALIPLAMYAGVAFADTTTVTRSDGYTITLSGPSTAPVGVPVTYTATCGPADMQAACPYGEFRAFGGPINRLGEGFGRGATGTYTFRAAGVYQIRYRVGAACIGSPRLACPIDVWLTTAAAAPPPPALDELVAPAPADPAVAPELVPVLAAAIATAPTGGTPARVSVVRRARHRKHPKLGGHVHQLRKHSPIRQGRSPRCSP